MKLKGFLQDSGNIVNVADYADSVEVTATPAIYSGKPEDYGFTESKTRVAEWNGVEYVGSTQNQHPNKWNSYMESPVDGKGGKNAYTSDKIKTLDDIKDKDGKTVTSRDKAQTPKKSKIDVD